ncbi:MAG: four helix bundle protein [Bacteroidota bacterium]
MTNPSILREKSTEFGRSIIKCVSNISKEKKEYVLSKQLLKSGTSIGANISEAAFAQSKSDFIHKLSISLKEANESRYWLNLLNQTNYLKEEEYKYLLSLNNDIIYLLIKSIKTAKVNLAATQMINSKDPNKP